MMNREPKVNASSPKAISPVCKSNQSASGVRLGTEPMTDVLPSRFGLPEQGRNHEDVESYRAERGGINIVIHGIESDLEINNLVGRRWLIRQRPFRTSHGTHPRAPSVNVDHRPPTEENGQRSTAILPLKLVSPAPHSMDLVALIRRQSRMPRNSQKLLSNLHPSQCSASPSKPRSQFPPSPGVVGPQPEVTPPTRGLRDLTSQISRHSEFSICQCRI
jgi:hypothetical protein